MGTLRLCSLIGVALLALGVFALGWREVARTFPRRAKIGMIVYSFPPGLVLLALGVARDFRLLGRHFIPLVPLVLGLMAVGILHLVTSRRRLGFIVGIAFGSVWFASCLSLRFAEAHRKDDYRAAAEIAKDALNRNEKVWWSADRAAAAYYGVPVEPSSEGNFAGVVLIVHPQTEELAKLARPFLVIASKPDIYEGSSDALGDYLRAGGFVAVRDLPAFTIWRRPPVVPAER